MDGQRNYKTEDLKTAQRYHEGTANSHNSQDSKDQRSIANRLAREEQVWLLRFRSHSIKPAYYDHVIYIHYTNQHRLTIYSANANRPTPTTKKHSSLKKTPLFPPAATGITPVGVRKSIRS